MGQAQSQARPLDPELEWRLTQLMHGYVDRVVELVRGRLGGEADRLIDVNVDVSVDQEATTARLELVVDVTDVVRGDQPCLWMDGVAELCTEAVAEMLARGEVAEDEAEKAFDECAEHERERFMVEHGGQPLHLAWSNGVDATAYLKTETVDLGYRVCVEDHIHLTWRITVTNAALEDIAGSTAAAEYDADRIAAAIRALLAAVKALAQ